MREATDWYPGRPGSLYTDHDFYPDTWKWIEFKTDDIYINDDGQIVHRMDGSVSFDDGRFVMETVDIYDSVRLEHLAGTEVDMSDAGEDYQGFGAYSQADLGIDESLLGAGRYHRNWKLDGEGASNGSNSLRNHLTLALLALSTNLFFTCI